MLFSLGYFSTLFMILMLTFGVDLVHPFFTYFIVLKVFNHMKYINGDFGEVLNTFSLEINDIFKVSHIEF